MLGAAARNFGPVHKFELPTVIADSMPRATCVFSLASVGHVTGHMVSHMVPMARCRGLCAKWLPPSATPPRSFELPKKTVPEPTAHWLSIVMALAEDGLRTRRLNTLSHSRIDRKWQSGRVISIKNLHSFWILEWSIGKRVHDAWRIDNQLRSTAKKKIK